MLATMLCKPCINCMLPDTQECAGTPWLYMCRAMSACHTPALESGPWHCCLAQPTTPQHSQHRKTAITRGGTAGELRTSTARGNSCKQRAPDWPPPACNDAPTPNTQLASNPHNGWVDPASAPQFQQAANLARRQAQRQARLQSRERSCCMPTDTYVTDQPNTHSVWTPQRGLDA